MDLVSREASKVHPTYRCGICRSLLIPGRPHSHKTTNRLVRSILGLSA
jgi:hypothetical protein